AIYGARMGTAVHGGARSAAPVIAKKRGRGTGCGGLRAGGRVCGLGHLPDRPAGRNRGAAGGILVCVLQRGRTQRARTLRPVEGIALGAGGDGSILDVGQSSVEDCGRSLWTRAVGIHGGVFAGLRAPAVFVLLRGAAAPGADARGSGQLPGAGVQHSARGSYFGRVVASDADHRNFAGAGGDRTDPDARTKGTRRRAGGRTNRVRTPTLLQPPTLRLRQQS